MEATHVSPSPITTAHTHPLLLVAAASVTVLSLAGVGALAGWLPGPGTHSAEPAKVAAAAPAPISIQQTVSVPQEKARPAAADHPTQRNDQRAPHGAGPGGRGPRADLPGFIARTGLPGRDPCPGDLRRMRRGRNGARSGGRAQGQRRRRRSRRRGRRHHRQPDRQGRHARHRHHTRRRRRCLRRQPHREDGQGSQALRRHRALRGRQHADLQ
jgi:hypothetical protein